jgi:hypothetical protein
MWGGGGEGVLIVMKSRDDFRINSDVRSGYSLLTAMCVSAVRPVIENKTTNKKKLAFGVWYMLMFFVNCVHFEQF